MIYTVKCVDDAVELAQKFKDSGKYDLFRGQRENWPLISSFARLSDEKREQELETLKRFFAWVHSTKELEYLQHNEDTMWAVAQHHGLKTNYIDFTTDSAVAGYFASENAEKIKGPSCIMCLDTSDLLGFWKLLSSDYPPPKIVHVEVPNLWRLEAQKGIFLQSNLDGFERIYDLDRIVFPPTKTVSYPKSNEIYPDRKSNLEKLLDQWIMLERLKAGSDAFEQIVGGNITKLTVKPENYPEEVILAMEINNHSSWNSILNDWLPTKRESFFAVKQAKAEIQVELNEDDLKKQGFFPSRDCLVENLRQQFENNKDIRTNLANFQCSVIGNKIYGIKIDSKPIEMLWDGLRNHPYSNQEVAEGIANCVALQILMQADEYRQTHNLEAVANYIFGETVEIEFGSEDGSYSRAFVSKKDLLAAVRPDLEKFLKTEYKKVLSSKNIAGLLQLIPYPNLLFEFQKLAHLFATQISPLQVLTRSRLAIFYTPAQLDKLGLP
jgi:hypothetical protein